MNRENHDNYKYQGLIIGFLIHKKIAKILHGRYILPFNITIPKIYYIENLIPQNIMVNH